MPIIDLQRSLRRLGRIRMGQQVPTRNGRTAPKKLDTWRLTSPSQEMLEAAAEVYGGTVTEWAGAPNGRQWELLTTSDVLDVVIPPAGTGGADMAFSQWYELWSGGGCQRRCDGVTEIMSGDGCACPADSEERQSLASDGKACKPTTRLFVMLPRLPDIGMWHLEAHGYYAAVELAATIDLLRRAGAGLVPAALRIDQRSVKRDRQTRNFGVPVIELRQVTAQALLSRPESVSLTAAVETRALEAPKDGRRPQPPLPGEALAVERASTAPTSHAVARGEVSPPSSPAPAPASQSTRRPPPARRREGVSAESESGSGVSDTDDQAGAGHVGTQQSPAPATPERPESSAAQRAVLSERIDKLPIDLRADLAKGWKARGFGSVKRVTDQPIAADDVAAAGALIAEMEAAVLAREETANKEMQGAGVADKDRRATVADATVSLGEGQRTESTKALTAAQLAAILDYCDGLRALQAAEANTMTGAGAIAEGA